MNLNKHIDFFNPAAVTKTIHIIGCGALGSRVAEIIARLGIEKINLWDYDTVDAHNITNQLFFTDQIKQLKTDALCDILKRINPKIKIIKQGKYVEQNISGYIFLMVDSITVRRAFVERHLNNQNILGLFDARMRLTDAQSYGADWTIESDRLALLSTMQFTSEEAKEATPISACGTTLSVTSTCMMVAALTVTNFMNLIKGNEVKKIILMDAFTYELNAF